MSSEEKHLFKMLITPLIASRNKIRRKKEKESERAAKQKG
jgi:hypothetical protein